jgi:hypothetical protein
MRSRSIPGTCAKSKLIISVALSDERIQILDVESEVFFAASGFAKEAKSPTTRLKQKNISILTIKLNLGSTSGEQPRREVG